LTLSPDGHVMQHYRPELKRAGAADVAATRTALSASLHQAASILLTCHLIEPALGRTKGSGSVFNAKQIMMLRPHRC